MDVREWSLDEGQRAAVADPGRLVAVTGGPGSGRTRALLARCLRLLEGGVPAAAMQVLVSSRRAVVEVRGVLGAAGGCRVDTVGDFCARLLRRVEGSGFTLLSERESVGLLGLFLSGGWPEGGDGLNDPTGRRRFGVEYRAARMFAEGPGPGDVWGAYLEECVRLDLYDRWRVVERAAELLEEDPGLGLALRNGPCRWLVADDVHVWGRAEQRLLEGLVGAQGSVTLAGDAWQRIDETEGPVDWLLRWWDIDVSLHRLAFCHRSGGGVCDLLGRMTGVKLGWYLPWGEDPVRLTGETPRESEALGAERVVDWLSRGVEMKDVAVIDLWGDGGYEGMALQMARVGTRLAWGRRDGDRAGDAGDAGAMLALLANPRNVAALSGSWWRGPEGEARQVGARLLKNVVSESGRWEGDLMSAVTALARSGAWTDGEAGWLSEVRACHDALSECLDRGGGMAEVLDWRRRRVFGPWAEGSDEFWGLSRSLWSVEGRGRDGLAGLMDRLAQDERDVVGEGAVEVLGVSDVVGREWRGVCVLNAVRPGRDEDARRRLRELYVACGRALEFLAVCDYRVDYLRRPAISLLSGLVLTENRRG